MFQRVVPLVGLGQEVILKQILGIIFKIIIYFKQYFTPNIYLEHFETRYGKYCNIFWDKYVRFLLHFISIIFK